MRLIDANKLRQDVLDWENCYNGYSDTYDKSMIIDEIDEQPTIEAEPIRHGRWIVDTEDWRHQIEWFKCSLCDFPTSTAYNYCPHCGTRMQKEEL